VCGFDIGHCIVAKPLKIGVALITVGLVDHHAHEYDSKSSKCKTLSHQKRKKIQKGDIFLPIFPEIDPISDF
jgi:hypothetical protein